MSLIGSYRYSSATSGSTTGATIVNFGGFPVSGLRDMNAIAACMYKWDATNSQWVPYTG